MTASTGSKSMLTTLRRIGALAAPYFNSEEKWRARGLLAAIVALNLGVVYMLVLINQWYRLFYDALQNKDQAVFWRADRALLLDGVRLHRDRDPQVLPDAAAGAALARLDDPHYLQRWMADQTFYRMELARFASRTAAPDNPDQRIQEDMNLFTDYTVTLSMGLLNAVVTLVSFVGILWGLSGGFAFTPGRHELRDRPAPWSGPPWSTASSAACITHYIGRPQIGLNFQQQRYEADFRHHLVRVREYSEAIALDSGEPVERGQLDLRFGACWTTTCS